MSNRADDKASVDLEMYVNKSTAPGLNSGKDHLEEILVLHLQGGKDFFVSLTTGKVLWYIISVVSVCLSVRR